MRFVWQLVAVAAVAFVGGQGITAAEGRPWLQLLVGVPTAVLAVFVYRWVVGRTERRPVTELALEEAPAALGRGTLIGGALFSAVMVNLFTSGYYEVDGIDSRSGAMGLLGFMAAAAVTEELMFRGVLFRIAEERVGTWIALVLTGTLFGLSHLLNPNATLWGAAAIAVEAGGMLTAAYVATRSLWLPIGLHFGWNFAASGVFSTEVSGNDTPPGLLDSSMSGPSLLTGGDFGPEGSVYSVLFCVLATIAFLWLAHRRGRVLPRRGRAERAGATATLPR
ncbi:CPBP family intramembrane metalloprotease domain-containing protein [Streptomyces dioscori]|uniref:CPBP family intramembrane metalloprotease domain-containing protein n=1 Tax=Streptomyces dioscori TaxID=2109333 RepID=A0A2P8PZG1_9ACTN|nr:CPBP family intramembrane glutamic endopeptidase [Streptomyces dioscori]PSM39365.1 CPBP family intramembrane metalloprotease domain-containing protein [Streptomyces dioscori]